MPIYPGAMGNVVVEKRLIYSLIKNRNQISVMHFRIYSYLSQTWYSRTYVLPLSGEDPGYPGPTFNRREPDSDASQNCVAPAEGRAYFIADV